MRGPKDISREIAEIAEKIEIDSGKRALERERKEEEEKKLFEKLDKRYVKKEDVEEQRKELVELFDKRYAKKEEGDGWWKKKLGLSAVIFTLFLGLLAGKLETGKWSGIFEMIFEILRN